MLPVDATMVVMCHVLFVCCMHVHGSGCRCDYCMFSRSVDTWMRPVMLMMSHYGLHDAELALWHSSLSESHRIARVRHELIAAMCYDQLRCLAITLWRCLIVLKCLWASPSSAEVGGLQFLLHLWARQTKIVLGFGHLTCVPYDQSTGVASCERSFQCRAQQLCQGFHHWWFCRYMEHGGWLVDVVVVLVAVTQSVFDKVSTFLCRRVVLRLLQHCIHLSLYVRHGPC